MTNDYIFKPNTLDYIQKFRVHRNCPKFLSFGFLVKNVVETEESHLKDHDQSIVGLKS